MAKVFKKVVKVVRSVAKAIGKVIKAVYKVIKSVIDAITQLVTGSLMGGKRGGGAATPGGRVQLPPITTNRVPIVYGTTAVKPLMTDAKISNDNRYMWFVLAITETPDASAGTITLDNQNGVKWNDKIAFKADPVGSAVTALHDYKNGNPTIDTAVAGDLNIWMYSRGSFTPIVAYADYANAVAVMSDAVTGGGIRTDNVRWTNNHTMDNLAFMIVRVAYNQDDSVTGLEDLTIYVRNSITNPADVVQDYMTNTRYGWGLPLDQIDLNSLNILRNYSNELITYNETVDGVTTSKQIPRYRIDGAIDTAGNCLQNTLAILNSCDSWLSWNEITGQWRVIVNRSWEEQHGNNINNLFAVFAETPAENTGSNTPPAYHAYITSNIDVSVGSRSEQFNEYESQYMWLGSGDTLSQLSIQSPGLARQLTVTAKLPTALLNPNERDRVLSLEFPFLTNPARTKFVSNRRLAQTRDTLSTEITCDYSAIQIEVGDVIRVYSRTHGWDHTSNMPNGKLFRVFQVTEQGNDGGPLLVSLILNEYSANVYTMPDLDSFVPALNTGMINPGLLSKPVAPVVTNLLPGLVVPTVDLTFTIPPDGITLGMEIWYYEGPPGMTTLALDGVEFLLYELQLPKTTAIYQRNSTHLMSLSALPKNQEGSVYYFRVRAISNQRKSPFSDSVSFNWDPTGPLYYTEIIVPKANNIFNAPTVASTATTANKNVSRFIELELPRVSNDVNTPDVGLYVINYQNIEHTVTGQVLSGPVAEVSVWSALEVRRTTIGGSVTSSFLEPPVYQGKMFTVPEASWSQAGSGLPLSGFGVISSADGEVVMAWTGNSPSTVYISTNGGLNFVAKNALDFGDSSFNPTSFALSNNGQVITLGLTNKLFVSLNSGNTWLDRGNFNGRVGLSGDGSTIIVAKISDGAQLRRSTNYGVSFSTITSGLPSLDSYLNTRQIYISPNALNVLISYNNDYIYRSTNGGVNFTSLTAFGQRAWYPNTGIVCSDNGQTIYASPVNQNPLKSVDGGVNVTTISNIGVNSIIHQCSSDGNTAYTTNGRYTTSGGTTWVVDTAPSGVTAGSVSTSFLGPWTYSRNGNTVYLLGNNYLLYKRALATNALTVTNLTKTFETTFKQNEKIDLAWVYFFTNDAGVTVNVKPTMVFSNQLDRRYLIERKA